LIYKLFEQYYAEFETGKPAFHFQDHNYLNPVPGKVIQSWLLSGSFYANLLKMAVYGMEIKTELQIFYQDF